ncbi:MAG: YbjQ family protein [Bacteroidales bacterium]|nr:YbjQ family protein [Bacteroidales bacterium]
MLITTTNTIEGIPIVEYKSVITANIVMGVNFLKEFVASFSDFFGGTSGKYRKEMDRAYNLAMEMLEDKAIALKANAVVGAKVDYDEISGGGKSMLMVSISGTAVVIQAPSKGEKHVSEVISRDTLNRLYLIETYKELINGGNWFPKQKDWDVFNSENMTELIPILFPLYITAELNNPKEPYDSYKYESTITNFPSFLEQLEFNEACSIIYGDWSDNSKTHKIIIDLIISNHLFNPEYIVNKIPSIDKHLAIKLLTADKNSYSADDSTPLKKIVDYFDNLPDTGHLEEEKGGLLKKGGTVMICEKGHKTSIEKGEYCQDEYCGLNIKGITQSEVEIIKEFSKKVQILLSVLK